MLLKPLTEDMCVCVCLCSQRRIDMLPKPLTEDICSLVGGKERLTFSVLWEMDDDANILHSTFTKAVIRSRAALTYQQAQVRNVCVCVCVCVCMRVCVLYFTTVAGRERLVSTSMY